MALEAAAYFIVAEALTNVVKHACASGARITAAVHGGALWLEIRDRAAALNGGLRVESPPGEGTVVAALLPIPPSDRRDPPGQRSCPQSETVATEDWVRSQRVRSSS
jgi:signal transduction histidine kinase